MTLTPMYKDFVPGSQPVMSPVHFPLQSYDEITFEISKL